ncbi:hypothetical protein AA0118_g8277 [Alternaria tenuissima]|nr:hypothetical protein AA0118_g8277 [Alternaria tenuissima]RYN96091.1 hypothetical protein AA0120_g3374 [Alternaria tenuissima]
MAATASYMASSVVGAPPPPIALHRISTASTSARATGSPGVSDLAHQDDPTVHTTTPPPSHTKPPSVPVLQPDPASIAAAIHAGDLAAAPAHVARPPLTGAACRIKPTEASPQLQQRANRHAAIRTTRSFASPPVFDDDVSATR